MKQESSGKTKSGTTRNSAAKAPRRAAPAPAPSDVTQDPSPQGTSAVTQDHDLEGHGIEVVRATLAATPIEHPSREQLIAEAAYHRAEARGFAAGHDIEDWLSAEAEVNARLMGEGNAY